MAGDIEKQTTPSKQVKILAEQKLNVLKSFDDFLNRKLVKKEIGFISCLWKVSESWKVSET